MNEIEILSSTDVKCIWGKKKKNVHEEYMPVPISDFCHVKSKIKENLKNLNTNHSLEKLLKACPNSALALHFKRLPKRKHDDGLDKNVGESSKR